LTSRTLGARGRPDHAALRRDYLQCCFSGDAMKKLATVIAVTGLIGTPAFAADMDVKAPPLTPAPVYNWTGWYVGVNAGASFGNVNTDFNASNITLAPVP
jgi:hypothetical protein